MPQLLIDESSSEDEKHVPDSGSFRRSLRITSQPSSSEHLSIHGATSTSAKQSQSEESSASGASNAAEGSQIDYITNSPRISVLYNIMAFSDSKALLKLGITNHSNHLNSLLYLLSSKTIAHQNKLLTLMRYWQCEPFTLLRYRESLGQELRFYLNRTKMPRYFKLQALNCLAIIEGETVFQEKIIPLFDKSTDRVQLDQLHLLRAWIKGPYILQHHFDLLAECLEQYSRDDRFDHSNRLHALTCLCIGYHAAGNVEKSKKALRRLLVATTDLPEVRNAHMAWIHKHRGEEARYEALTASVTNAISIASNTNNPAKLKEIFMYAPYVASDVAPHMLKYAETYFHYPLPPLPDDAQLDYHGKLGEFAQALGWFCIVNEDRDHAIAIAKKLHEHVQRPYTDNENAARYQPFYDRDGCGLALGYCVDLLPFAMIRQMVQASLRNLNKDMNIGRACEYTLGSLVPYLTTMGYYRARDGQEIKSELDIILNKIITTCTLPILIHFLKNVRDENSSIEIQAWVQTLLSKYDNAETVISANTEMLAGEEYPEIRKKEIHRNVLYLKGYLMHEFAVDDAVKLSTVESLLSFAELRREHHFWEFTEFACLVLQNKQPVSLSAITSFLDIARENLVENGTFEITYSAALIIKAITKAAQDNPALKTMAKDTVNEETRAYFRAMQATLMRLLEEFDTENNNVMHSFFYEYFIQPFGKIAQHLPEWLLIECVEELMYRIPEEPLPAADVSTLKANREQAIAYLTKEDSKPIIHAMATLLCLIPHLPQAMRSEYMTQLESLCEIEFHYLHIITTMYDKGFQSEMLHHLLATCDSGDEALQDRMIVASGTHDEARLSQFLGDMCSLNVQAARP